MSFFRTKALVVILAFVARLNTAAAQVDQNVNTQDIDRSVKPGDDFYRYANGGWLGTAAIPDGLSSYGTREILTEKTSQRVRNLIQDAAAGHSVGGSTVQKVGAYYASFMDEDGIEAKGTVRNIESLVQSLRHHAGEQAISEARRSRWNMVTTL